MFHMSETNEDSLRPDESTFPVDRLDQPGTLQLGQGVPGGTASNAVTLGQCRLTRQGIAWSKPARLDERTQLGGHAAVLGDRALSRPGLAENDTSPARLGNQQPFLGQLIQRASQGVTRHSVLPAQSRL
jgi:hypothetical protein